jgi:DNA-binding transcriptional MerR regulator
MKIKNPISLNELAKEMNINKSKLHYYAQLGLIVPNGKIGGTIVLEKIDAVKKLKTILTNQKKGKTLKEIKEII